MTDPDYSYMENGEVKAMTDDQIAQKQSDDANWVAEQAQRDKDTANAIIATALADLDTYIPRGLEDTWSAIGFDTTKLPQKQQDRLAQKIALRAKYQK